MAITVMPVASEEVVLSTSLEKVVSALPEIDTEELYVADQFSYELNHLFAT